MFRAHSGLGVHESAVGSAGEPIIVKGKFVSKLNDPNAILGEDPNKEDHPGEMNVGVVVHPNHAHTKVNRKVTADYLPVYSQDVSENIDDSDDEGPVPFNLDESDVAQKYTGRTVGSSMSIHGGAGDGGTASGGTMSLQSFGSGGTGSGSLGLSSGGLSSVNSGTLKLSDRQKAEKEKLSEMKQKKITPLAMMSLI